jgi:hypothetical protein
MTNITANITLVRSIRGAGLHWSVVVSALALSLVCILLLRAMVTILLLVWRTLRELIALRILTMSSTD